MIDTFFTVLRKGMVLIMFLIFGFATTYIPLPNHDGGYHNVAETHAGGVVVEIGPNLLNNIYNAIQATISAGYAALEYIQGSVLDGIVWAIAKQMIANMVSSMVDWINSGFEGSPAFIQDLDGFLLESADVAVGELINNLAGNDSYVCSPFLIDVQFAVALQWDYEREGRERACTLTGLIDDFEGFIGGNFQRGGWEGWFDLVAEPKSTPYGSILTAQNQASINIANRQGEDLELLEWGSGFLSGELCQTATGDDGPQEECFITKPGRVITEQLNKALGRGDDALIEADEVNEVVIALLGQLSTQVITGASGLLGLSGGTGYTYSGYSRGSFVDDLADGVIDGSASGGTTGTGNVNPGDAGTLAGRDFIADSLTDQTTILNELQTYINDLTNFINNPLNSEEEVTFATLALGQATDMLDRVNDGVNGASPILNSYDALEAEYAGADANRRAEIRLEQGALLQEFNALRLVTTQELDIYSSSWDSVLDRGTSSSVNTPEPCNTSSVEPDCVISL